MENPERPFVAILGGAKVKDKIAVIHALIPKVDTLIIGGGMSYTFQKAKGYEIGKSLFDESNFAFAKELLHDHPDKVKFPVDVVVASANPFDTDLVADRNQNRGYRPDTRRLGRRRHRP